MRTLALAAVVAIAVGLTGCNEESGGPTFELVTFNALSGSSTLDRSDTVDLKVTSMSSTVDIRSDVHTATFNGQNNTVTIRDGVTIDKLELDGMNTTITIESNVTVKKTVFTGSGYTVQIPNGMQFDHTDDGTGNQVTTY